MAANQVNPDATATLAGLLQDGMTMSGGFGLCGFPTARCMALRAEGLAAFRAERLVFREVGFAIPAGGALLLLGPNGSGKSTLLRLLAGLKRPDAGTITWDGEDIAIDPGSHASQVAYVGHLDAVKPGLTTAENLVWDARLGGGNVDAALAALDLAPLAAIPARMLSAGQRRRLALARLALTRAPLWLLDEPTIGLDAAAIDKFGAMLVSHRARGGVIVAATHVTLPVPGAAELRLG
ncbi:MAG TPA: heme ABC exporter ATP-binding protein CcmA [Acetobacteraceae bacterium]|jgi:heme exporter protein A